MSYQNTEEHRLSADLTARELSAYLQEAHRQRSRYVAVLLRGLGSRVRNRFFAKTDGAGKHGKGLAHSA